MKNKILLNLLRPNRSSGETCTGKVQSQNLITCFINAESHHESNGLKEYNRKNKNNGKTNIKLIKDIYLQHIECITEDHLELLSTTTLLKVNLLGRGTLR